METVNNAINSAGHAVGDFFVMLGPDVGQAIMFSILIALVGFGILMTLVLLGLFDRTPAPTYVAEGPHGDQNNWDGFPVKDAAYYDQKNEESIAIAKAKQTVQKVMDSQTEEDPED